MKKRFLEKGSSKYLSLLALILSLIFHLLTLQLKVPEYSLKVPVKKEKLIKVTLIDSFDSRIKNQIVNSEDGGNDEAPAHSRFLGKKNQSFEKQTIAEKIGTFKVGKKSHQFNLKDLSIKDTFKVSQFLPKPNKPAQVQEPVLADVSSNDDYVEGIETGMRTHLNTREYKYWGFYNRVRNRLNPIWTSLLLKEMKALHHSGRKFSGENNFRTHVRVLMDKDGNLMQTNILSSSGYSQIDNVAVLTFEKVTPIRGIPAGLIKDNKTAMEWVFVIIK